VHSIGQTGGICIPSHQIGERLPRAAQILRGQLRPHQIVRAQQLERAGHLARVEIALLPHRVLEIGDLAVVDEELELAGVGEIDLRRQQGHALQALVAIARHGSGGDGQHRAAQAIAASVDSRIRTDLRHDLERDHQPQTAIVIEGQIPLLGRRIAP
jgi:hypothetical protein